MSFTHFAVRLNPLPNTERITETQLALLHSVDAGRENYPSFPTRSQSQLLRLLRSRGKEGKTCIICFDNFFFVSVFVISCCFGTVSFCFVLFPIFGSWRQPVRFVGKYTYFLIRFFTNTKMLYHGSSSWCSNDTISSQQIVQTLLPYTNF